MFDDLQNMIRDPLDEMIQAVHRNDFGRLAQEAASLREIALRAKCDPLATATERLQQAIREESTTDEIRRRLGNVLQLSENLGGANSKGPIGGEAGSSDGQRRPITSSLPLDDPDFLRIVVGFVDHLNSQLTRMKAVWEAGDLVELARLAHWLKGAGGTLGFDVFTEPAKRLQQLALEGQTDEIEGAIEELIRTAERIELPENSAAECL